MRKSETQRIVEHFYEIGTLRRILRAHNQTLHTNDETDNISTHSFRVTMIGWQLAIAEGANVETVLKMCLIHDLEEIRSGDNNWMHKPYIIVDVKKIRDDQYANLPNEIELHSLSDEYEERLSIEAKVTKDADLLDQILLLREYEMAGNQEVVRWLVGKAEGKKLFTITAKNLAAEICAQTPSAWWKNVWTDKNR